MSKKLPLIFIVLLFASIVCPAQSARKISEPTGLTLEVTFFKGREPAHLDIYENVVAPRGGWFALFKRLPNWQPATDSLPVRAINVVSRLENSVVKVKVSVFTGQRFHDREEFVANYEMKENDKIIVENLTKFGVEPIEISVVKVTPAVSILPAALNKTASLQIMNLEPNYSTLPSFKLKLLNTSNKSVLAFTFEIRINGRIELSGMPQGSDERPLIEAGNSYERTISNDFQDTKLSDGEIPQVKNNQTIIISSVVFEDGTFEGDQLDAARYLSFSLGRQLQIQRMMPLLRQTAENKPDLLSFSEQISNLSVSVDENTFDEFLKNFPNLSKSEKMRLRTASEVASQGEKKRLLDNLEIVTKSQKGKNAIAARDWLIEVVELYQNRLEKLSKITKIL
ncbi:MAG: hypothetical protein ABI686_12935 [Acidobacteriota bacterium]